METWESVYDFEWKECQRNVSDWTECRKSETGWTDWNQIEIEWAEWIQNGMEWTPDCIRILILIRSCFYPKPKPLS